MNDKDINQHYKIVSVKGTFMGGGLDLFVQNISSSTLYLGSIKCKMYYANGTVRDNTFLVNATLNKGEIAKGNMSFIEKVKRIDLIPTPEAPIRGVLNRGYFPALLEFWWWPWSFKLY